MTIKNNSDLLKFLKKDFIKTLKKELTENQALYREASLQCILYNEIRNNLSPTKYIYPEINYGKYKKNGKSNKADLMILSEGIYDILDNDKNKKVFNITYYNEKICESVIELKFKSTLASIKEGIEEDISAIKHNGNKIENKIILFVYEVNEGDKIDLRDLVDLRKIKGINIIGYIWDGKDLKLIPKEL